MAGDTQKPMPFEAVAVLVAAIEKDGFKLGMKHFQLMAELDGTRTKSSFEHEFRTIKARAREINGMAGNGTPAPTSVKKPTAKGKTGASDKKRKGGKKDASEDDDNDDDEGSPTKKSKVKDEAKDEEKEDGDDFWDQ
ncbi:hypothetical protein LTR10_005067 [Elasticomyces elasticus]|nr:hypothetical protein LTR10_005067 [Elasticomyces elasticus]KAK4975808.1 hypothetical protein LTR42_003429 [Elasticomyces elasticus]